MMDIFSHNTDIDSSLFLYHYTKFKTAIRIISNNALMFNVFNNVNDPRENKKWGINRFNCDKNHTITINDIDRINEKLRLKWKVLCMVSDVERNDISVIEKEYCRGYSHSRMWAQYAENHKGACLVFDKEKLKKCINQTLSSKGILYSGNVVYEDFSKLENGLFRFDISEMNSVGLDACIDNHLKKFYFPIFFLKKKDWESENEWRFVFYSKSDEEIFINYGDSLLGIIFGCDCQYYSNYNSLFKKKQVRTGVMCWNRGHPGVSERFWNP